ncbi:uncharacterized protein LOC135433591 [Drosophila montana]|uniref:uncharacterized protein LOC135433591 n=1 Tax=Drosophila montana TaxID=40370 RepID=UPI00313AFFEE
MNDKYLPPDPPSYGFTSAPPGGSQNYPPQGYPPQGYPPQGYPTQPAYPQPGYPPQNYAPPPQNYGQPPPQNFGPPPPQNYGPPPPQNYGPPPTQPLPPSPIVVQPTGWYNRNQKNKPQSNAAGAAALIFLSGGMNIAWSIGFNSFYFKFLPVHTRVAWFIGAIIGGVFSCFLANKLPKKVVLCFCSLLVMIGGIVIATTRYNVQAVEASLYLDGIANGLAFAPTLALVGEVSVPYMRGAISASIEQMCYTLGFFIQIVYVSSWYTTYNYNSFNAEQMHGVLAAIYGLIGLIIAGILCIESPVITLANGEEQKALDALRRLQRPYTITTETYAQLEEHKRYLAQNKDLSTGQSIVQALPAFVRLCYLRALNAMSLSAFVYYALIVSLTPYYSLNTFTWQFIAFGAARWLGTFISSFCMESAGRKGPTLLGLLVSGGLAFGIGKLIGDVYEIYHVDGDAILALLCVFQLFAGIAFTATSAYLSEAYPLGVKQHFIASTFIVEMLVYIIISSVQYSIQGHAIFFYFVGALYLIGFFLGIWCLPETRRTTLRESQDKFKGMLSRSF